MRKSQGEARDIFSPENSFFLRRIKNIVILACNRAAKSPTVRFAVNAEGALEARLQGIKSMNIDCAVKRGLVLPAVCGAFLGVAVGALFPLPAIALAVCAAALLVLAFPKAGLVLSFALISLVGFLPHPSVCLLAVALLVLFGLGIKAISLKIKYKPCLLDVAALGFGILVLLSGIFSAGGAASFFKASLYFLLLICYFAASALLSDKLADRAVSALILSAAVSSCVGIWQIFNGGFESGWLDSSVFSGISVRITSTFDNPNVYAAYLLLVMPFVLERILSVKSLKGKIVYISLFLVLAVCMAETWSRGAWLGLFLEIFLFLFFRLKRSLPYAAASLPIIGLGASVFAPNIVARLASIGDLSDTSVSYRISAWKGIMKMLSANSFFGIGFGESAFLSVYPWFAYSGASAVKHSHSLYLQILVETGTVGLLVFLAVIFIFSKSCLEYIFRTSRQDSGIAAAGFSAVYGILLMGFTDHIWYNSRVFLCFWLIIALTNAKIREKER